MSTGESSWKLSASKNYHTIRGDDVADLRMQAESVGVSADAVVTGFQEAWGVAQATQALAEAGVVDPNNANVVRTVAQPGHKAEAAPAADPGTPPGLEHPGNCAHNLPRVYGAAFTAKNGKQISARWECGIPWAAGAATNDSRCKPIYIKD
jgi:hypothetical protein